MVVAWRNSLSQGAVIADLRNTRSKDEHYGRTASPLLRLTLFGQMEAIDGAGRSVLPRSRKTRGVLAILALAAPRPVLRSRLTALLWSQRAKEQAHASLRQSVHELQRCLGLPAGTLLHADRTHLTLLDNGLWVDVSVLLRATVEHADDIRLFQSTLLDGLGGLDLAFDEWLTNQHQRATRSARSVADGILALASTARARIEAAEQLLTIDPAHEGAWQALISAHLDLGDRGTARSAFERCTISLSRASLVPSRKTEALLESQHHLRPATTLAVNGHKVPRAVRLVVLPTRNLDRGNLDCLLPGLTEEIIAAISCFRWITCIPTESIANSLPAPDQIPHDFDADYLLDSTLQRSGNQVRILVRLVDFRSGGNVVWARRIDRAVVDTLMLQGDIAAETAAQIDPELLLREGERRLASEPRASSAYDLTLGAIPAIYRLEPSSFHAAGGMLEAAIANEPTNASAHAWSAYWYLLLVGQAWAKDPATAVLRAGELAERAVTLDPGDARALTLVGHVRAFLHKQPEQACALHERALALNPNLPLAWCCSGLALSYLGQHDNAIEHITRAHHLSPYDPHTFFFDMALAMPHFLRHDFDNALIIGRRAVELNPGFSSTYKGYLAILGHLAHREEANRVLSRLLELEPAFSIRDAIERSPMQRQQDLDLYADGLRRAGLREA
jgi:DNA-binding SARP family transcriptional activator/Flp pilus assembly protein TadD